MTRGPVAAIGFAPHSGWTAVIGLTAGREGPRFLLRGRIDMTDPRDPGSKQPYHTLEPLPLDEATRRLASFEASARRMAREGLARIVAQMKHDGRRVVAAGVLDSSGRRASSLADTLASHALIHTADGEHFRAALAAAAEASGIPVSRVRAKNLQREAESALGTSAAALQARLKEMGRAVGPPWGADQKGAALLAWLLLPR